MHLLLQFMHTQMLYTYSICKHSIGLIPIISTDVYGETRMKVEKGGPGKTKSNEKFV